MYSKHNTLLKGTRGYRKEEMRKFTCYEHTQSGRGRGRERNEGEREMKGRGERRGEGGGEGRRRGREGGGRRGDRECNYTLNLR